MVTAVLEAGWTAVHVPGPDALCWDSFRPGSVPTCFEIHRILDPPGSCPAPRSSPQALSPDSCLKVMITALNASHEVRLLLQPYDFELSQDMRPFLEEYW